MEEDNIAFLSNASTKPKSYGHNKFQIQLQESNTKIESLENIIKDKDLELELFKNNMKTFHIQLQNKNLEINKLETDILTYKERINTLTLDLEKLSVDTKSNTYTLTEKHNTLCDENNNLLNTIEHLNKTQDESINKYNDIKSKYQITLDLLENKSQEIISLTTKYDNIYNELNLLKELNLKQEKDIDTIKQELFQTKNETSTLKTQLYEKDIYLGQLHKKLSLETYTIHGTKRNIDNNYNLNNNDYADTDTDTDVNAEANADNNDNNDGNNNVNADNVVKLDIVKSGISTSKRGIKINRR